MPDAPRGPIAAPLSLSYGSCLPGPSLKYLRRIRPHVYTSTRQHDDQLRRPCVGASTGLTRRRVDRIDTSTGRFEKHSSNKWWTPLNATMKEELKALYEWKAVGKIVSQATFMFSQKSNDPRNCCSSLVPEPPMCLHHHSPTLLMPQSQNRFGNLPHMFLYPLRSASQSVALLSIRIIL